MNAILTLGVERNAKDELLVGVMLEVLASMGE